MKSKCAKTSRTASKIRTAIHEESEAIRDYGEDAKKVDSKTAKLFKHIKKQEVHHKEELKKRLKSL